MYVAGYSVAESFDAGASSVGDTSSDTESFTFDLDVADSVDHSVGSDASVFAAICRSTSAFGYGSFIDWLTECSDVDCCHSDDASVDWMLIDVWTVSFGTVDSYVCIA